ncbi:cytochrome c oxidase subunit II [Virgibacillus phasianinus]|uniref:Cytochrome c oxidase subunit 2 n=1 Tax=Virgibacillus phasianinus TaxID=2017483 RepID=A0A220U1S7_9BACI|nr:cytochrome c oxidase subunit II [Virgibacillus phasianinus]ASK62027.1 cytochrome c oxidase subunit II [Virgibacillus phasianinus]
MKKLLTIPILLLLAGCDINVLDAKSETGQDQAFLIWFSFGLMMIVLVVVFVLFARFVWKYRETDQNKHTLPKDVKGNKKLEITWTTLAILLLVVLAVPTVAITYDQSPVLSSSEEAEQAVHVNVTGQQFFWTFEYENGKETTNKLVIPANKTIVFHLISKDVIHSFWIPQLGGKTDVLPGKELLYKLKNPKEGTYEGKCAEFCGVQHTKMQFTTRVVSNEEYENWLKE